MSVWVEGMVYVEWVECPAQQARNVMLRSAKECYTEETRRWVISIGGKLYMRWYASAVRGVNIWAQVWPIVMVGVTTYNEH